MKEIQNPIELAQQAAKDFSDCYKTDLLSVILYGSAISEDFNPKSSDINLLIVLKNMKLELLEQSLPIQEKLIKKRFSRPLFLDIEYIDSSLDTFPIEFLNIKESYQVLYGKDVIKDLQISSSFLRLQVERELKGKWLHLLQEWLELKSKPSQLSRLVHVSIKDFSATFRALLYLRDQPIPHDKLSLFKAVTKAYGLSENSLEHIKSVSTSDSLAQIQTNYPAYTQVIKELIQIIDHHLPKENKK